MIRTAVNEPAEATMSRFFHGLNEDVQERIEMVTSQDFQRTCASSYSCRAAAEASPKQQPNLYIKHLERFSSARSRRKCCCRFSLTQQETTKEANASKVESSNTLVTCISNIQCHTCKGRGHFKKDCPNLKKVLLTNDGYVTDDSSDKSESEKKDANYCTFETGAPLSSDGGDGVNLIVHKVAHDDAPIIENGQR